MFNWIKKTIKEFRELKHLAYHDSLTGLLNRNWFSKHKADITHKYVYFIDINDLHIVNQKGHTHGDNYIKMVVESIPVFDDDILMRYAGDEFILFSNRENAIQTNDLISVGSCKNEFSLILAINTADANMLDSKRNHKLKRE